MRISDWSSDVCSSDLFQVMVQALALTRRPSAEQEQTWNIRVKRMAGRSPPQRPTACRDGTERLAACLPRYRADPWSGDTATVPAVLSSRPKIGRAHV